MGKLHKIRKAVEKNPEQFMERTYSYKRTAQGGQYTGRSYGANVFDRGLAHTGAGKTWPSRYGVLSNPSHPRSSHKKFVASILRKLGYPV